MAGWAMIACWTSVGNWKDARQVGKLAACAPIQRLVRQILDVWIDVASARQNRSQKCRRFHSPQLNPMFSGRPPFALRPQCLSIVTALRLLADGSAALKVVGPIARSSSPIRNSAPGLQARYSWCGPSMAAHPRPHSLDSSNQPLNGSTCRSLSN